MKIRAPFELQQRPNDVRAGQASNVANWYMVPLQVARYKLIGSVKTKYRWGYFGVGQFVGFMDTYRSVVKRWRSA